MSVPKAQSYGAHHLRERDRMEHAPACTIGQVPLLAFYKLTVTIVSNFQGLTIQ